MISNRIGIGSLIQLAAKGPQEQILYDNTTQFIEKPKRHTSFGFEEVCVDPIKPETFGNKITFIVPPDAHLVSNLWIQLKLPKLIGTLSTDVQYYNNNTMLKSFNKIEIYIGKYLIQTYTPEYFSKKVIKESKRYGWNEMIAFYNTDAGNEANNNGGYLYLPLRFINEQYFPLKYLDQKSNQLKVEIFTNPLSTIMQLTEGSTGYLARFNEGLPLEYNAQIVVTNTYLDQFENSKFFNSRHDIVFEQIEYQNEKVSDTSIMIDLEFRHVVKDFIVYFDIATTINKVTEIFLILDGVKNELNVGHLQFVQQEHLLDHVDDSKLYYAFTFKPQDSEVVYGVNMDKMMTKRISMKFQESVTDEIHIFSTCLNQLVVEDGHCRLKYM